jgi:hypothetical protein
MNPTLFCVSQRYLLLQGMLLVFPRHHKYTSRSKEDNLMTNRNKLIVPQANSIINEIKYEIANEFGVYDFGAYATARGNGSVGGEITKRLVKLAESSLAGEKI